MKKEKLSAKIELLEKNKEKLIANVNATEGALQLARELLTDWDKDISEEIK